MKSPDWLIGIKEFRRITAFMRDGYKPTKFVAVGYPKTGNTWLRFMLGRYLKHVYDLDRTPLMEPVDFDWLRKCRVPVLGEFSHGPLEWNEQTADDLKFENVIRPYLDRKVIILIRHPLDVLASHYYHNLYQAGGLFEGSISDFERSPIFGLEKFFKFYHLWAGVAVRDNVIVWRYEDAKSDAATQFEKLLNFLDLPVVPKHLETAIAEASFDKMRNMERSGDVPVYRSSGFKMFSTGDQNNPNAYHVRKGEVGGYENEFSSSELAELRRLIERKVSSVYGY